MTICIVIGVAAVIGGVFYSVIHELGHAAAIFISAAFLRMRKPEVKITLFSPYRAITESDFYETLIVGQSKREARRIIRFIALSGGLAVFLFGAVISLTLLAAACGVLAIFPMSIMIFALYTALAYFSFAAGKAPDIQFFRNPKLFIKYITGSEDE